MPTVSETLEAVRVEFDALVQGFDVHEGYKRFATSRTDDGGPHVELHDGIFAYVVTERGSEYERRETKDPDELLYWLVSDTTREAAQLYELKHRLRGRDCRRLLFSKHIEILQGIRSVWAERKRAEYEEVLLRQPYNDRA